jgi:protein-tyrosine phosphatase
MRLTIAELQVGQGVLGICPSPGSAGFYQADIEAIRHWHPALVVTFTTVEEITRVAATLPQDLAALGIQWLHLPIPDYGTPTDGWPEISTAAHAALNKGQKILLHCMGGCGRSGMAALRLMVESGEAPEAALKRLRQTRPCAVETDAQYQWASQQFI